MKIESNNMSHVSKKHNITWSVKMGKIESKNYNEWIHCQVKPREIQLIQEKSPPHNDSSKVFKNLWLLEKLVDTIFFYFFLFFFIFFYDKFKYSWEISPKVYH